MKEEEMLNYHWLITEDEPTLVDVLMMNYSSKKYPGKSLIGYVDKSQALVNTEDLVPYRHATIKNGKLEVFWEYLRR